MFFKRLLPLMLSGVIAVTSAGINNTSVFAASGQITEDNVVSEEDAAEVTLSDIYTDNGILESDTETDEVKIYEDDLVVDEEEKDEILKSTIVSSGASGGLTWVLDDEGTFTLSGKGDMHDFYWVGNMRMDWYYDRDLIKRAVIDADISYIPVYSFYGCKNMTSIIIPETVSWIDKQAFYGCESLESINLPERLSYIGVEAFLGCNSLTSVNLSDSLETIEKGAFRACNSLESISIPGSISRIEDEAFSFCSSLTSIIIPNSVTYIGDKAFYQCTSVASITIPNSVTSIGAAAFNGTAITSISIPNSIVSIGETAFGHCTELESVVIPDSVRSIGKNAFYFCENLKTASLPDSITTLESGMFDHCEKLTTTSIPVSVSNIGDYAFSCCNSLTDIDINDSIESIGKGAFSYCEGIEKVELPNSVKSIGSEAFRGCENLESLTLPGTISVIMENTFEGCKKLKSIDIPESVTEIRSEAFKGCEMLYSIELPDTLTYISYGLFEDCTGLSSITIPGSATEIEGRAFFGCTGLTEVVIPESVTSIGNSAFYVCENLETIIIPESVTSIGQYAFANCGFSSVTIPESLTSLSTGTFSYCRNLDTFVLPRGIHIIPAYLLMYCSSLRKVYIPLGVTEVNKNAFYECPITDVYFEGDQLEFNEIRINTGNENFRYATKHYNAYNPSGEEGETYTITVSAGEHCSISPSGLVKVHAGEDITITITPDPGFIVTSITVDGEVMVGDCREIPFTNVDSDHSIYVFYKLSSNQDEYDKEKLKYTGNFKFSLSNSDDAVELTEYPFDVDLGDFFTPSTTVQNSLIRMSMRVAMAAMDPNDYTKSSESFGFRASFIKDLMDKLDFQYKDEDIQYESPNGDTIGTAIGSRTIKKGDEEYTLVMVAVRGGGYLNEWAGNVNVGDGLSRELTTDHHGFDLAANKVVARIKNHLSNNKNITDFSKVKIWITGYSRAAAVSNLVAAKLDDGGEIGIEGINRDNIYAFCFECPQNTLNSYWNDQKYNNIINIVNLVDLVPLVAPKFQKDAYTPGKDGMTKWEYNRYGTTLYINDGYSKEDGFNDKYNEMKSNYTKILGNYYTPDRLNSQLDGYSKKRINRQFREILSDIFDIPDNRYPLLYVKNKQNSLYNTVFEEMKNVGEIGALEKLKKLVKIATPILCSGSARDKGKVEGELIALGSYIAQNHYPELALAWVNTLNLNDYLALSDVYNKRELVINCPVDVTIFDCNNMVVGKIINNEPTVIESTIDAFIDENEQKIVVLPLNREYRIEAVAYDYGNVSITATDFAGDAISPYEIESYLNICVKKDETVSIAVDDTITVLGTDGNILTPDIAQVGEELVSHYVETVLEGPGTVEGGGSFYAGEFCQVTAVPDENNYFTGWYVDEQCVSTEATYRFPVLNDTTVKAVFTDIPEDAFSVQFKDTAADPYDGLNYNSSTNHYETIFRGTQIKPEISVIGANGLLKEGEDYTVKYSNNTNYNSKGKPATITVTGKGNFTGKKVLEFYILQADLGVLNEKGLLTAPDDIKVQSGKKVSPEIAYGDYKLKAADMDISNKSAIKEDTSIDITGKGNFTGKLENINVKVIAAADTKNYTIKASLKPGTHTYNGEAQILTCSTPEVPAELTVTAGTSKTPLIENVDFSVTYKSNVAAGTATVKVKALGEYLGEVTKTFKIKPDKISAITAELADPDEEILYDRTGSRPDVTVTRADSSKEVLSPGKDYKVTYANNKSVGTGKYTVSFIGNYKGHPAISNRLFSIKAAPFDRAKADSADMIYTKPGKYMSAPIVSIGGMQLSAKDYSVKYYDGETELTAKSKLTLDSDTTAKEITVKITGKGNYQAQEIISTYRVRKADESMTNLTKVKIVAKEKNAKGKDVAVGKQEYTGKAIRPQIRVLVQQGKTWTEVPAGNYSVSYINNVNRGKATIILNGDGVNSYGSKKVNFTIGTKNLGLFSWLFG